MAVMQTPASLSPEARESFTNAVATIEAMGDDPTHYRDAIERYSLANATAELVRAEWEREGRPMVRSGSGPSRPHALFVALRDSRDTCGGARRLVALVACGSVAGAARRLAQGRGSVAGPAGAQAAPGRGRAVVTEPGTIDDLIREHHRAGSGRDAEGDRLRPLRERIAAEEGIPNWADEIRGGSEAQMRESALTIRARLGLPNVSSSMESAISAQRRAQAERNSRMDH